MSHFPVLVALPAGTDLDTVTDVLADIMEPWSENRAVAPYRDYEGGDPAEHWTVSTARRGAENLRNGTGLKKHVPGRLGWSSHESNKTHAQQREDFAVDAEWAERIGDNPTWATIVTLHNERYPEYEPLLYDSETDRAYVMTTYNPDSKWDFWSVGGRWLGYFTAKPGATVIPARPRRSEEITENRCNGGAIASLDLASMRASAAGSAELRYQRWEALSADHPAAKPRAHFSDLVEQGVCTRSEAREQYRAQPLVNAAISTDLAYGCPVDEFAPPRDEYVAEAARAAVPGYALVTLDGEWVAPGRMGYWGTSTEDNTEMAAYLVRANDYIDGLDPATVLVVVDCHI